LTDAWDRHEPATGFGSFRHPPDVRVDRGDRCHNRGARGDKAPHGGGKTGHPLAGRESLIHERGRESARKPDPEHNGQAPDLVFQGHPLADQLLARDDERADRVGRQRLHVNGLEEAGAGQVRQTSRVVAVGLVGREGLERLIGLPAFDTGHREAEPAQSVEQDRRDASGLEDDGRQLGAFANSFAIASAVDADLPS